MEVDAEAILMDLVRAYVLNNDDAFLEPRFFDGTREALAQLDQRLALVDSYHVKISNKQTLRKARSTEPSPATVLNPLSVEKPMLIDMLEYYLYYGKMGRYYDLVQFLKRRGGHFLSVLRLPIATDLITRTVATLPVHTTYSKSCRKVIIMPTQAYIMPCRIFMASWMPTTQTSTCLCEPLKLATTQRLREISFSI